MGVCVFRVGSWGFIFFTVKVKLRAETCLPHLLWWWWCWSPGSHGAEVTNSVPPASGGQQGPQGDNSHRHQHHHTRLEQSLTLEPGLKVSGE